MHWLLLGIAGGFAFVYLTRLYWSDAAKITRSPLVTAAITVLVLTLLVLVSTGRAHWLSAAVAGVVPFLRRATGLVRFAPLLAGVFEKLRKRHNHQHSDHATPHSPTLSVAEARLLLDVSEHATAAEIISAHRRLISRNHPDKGGSTYIAAQLNAAKDLLLDGQNA